jgi:hypothetical protein
MVMVAVVGAVLALLRAFGDLGIVALLLSSGLAFPAFHSTSRRRRAAAWAFVLAGILSAVLATVASVYLWTSYFVPFLPSFLLVPLIVGFGTSWAVEATRKGAPDPQSPRLAWLSVFLMAALPLSMMFTLWPLRLAFLVSRPALNRLADRVAAGGSFDHPEWAGLYRVVDAKRAVRSGKVALIIDANPSGASGFVRIGPQPVPPDSLGPLYGLNLDEEMDWRWRYQEED